MIYYIYMIQLATVIRGGAATPPNKDFIRN